VLNPRLALSFAVAVSFVISGVHILKSRPRGVTSISVHPPVVDLGSARQSELIQFEFKIENTSEAPISLVSLQTSCGCTIMNDVSGVSLLPGTSIEINGKFDTTGKRGESQSLAMLSYKKENDVGAPVRHITLQVKVNVLPTLEFRPEQIATSHLLQHEANGDGDYLIQVAPAFDGTFKLLGSSASVAWVHATVLKSTCSRSGLAVDPAVVRVSIDSDTVRTGSPLNAASAEVYLHSDCSDEKTLVIPLVHSQEAP